jgi:hypothetical protein
MQSLLRLDESQVKNFEIDSRVGISGTKTCWKFPCVYDDSTEKFFVWMGDVMIDKFTKTTFMNLVNFGQNLGATNMVLIMDREHTQKGNHLEITITDY